MAAKTPLGQMAQRLWQNVYTGWTASALSAQKRPSAIRNSGRQQSSRWSMNQAHVPAKNFPASGPVSSLLE